MSAAIGAGVVLLVLGAPFLNIKFTGIDSAAMPHDSHAGKVYDTLDRDFPGSLQSPVNLIQEAPTDAGPKLAAYAGKLERIDGVAAVAAPANSPTASGRPTSPLRRRPLARRTTDP
ncbi:hypothetical protein NKH77_09640 [Streptomyces sp. M19]